MDRDVESRSIITVCRACARSRGCKSPTVKEVGTVKRRQLRHREVGSERSRSHSHDPTNRNRIVRLEAVGELAEGSETRDFQDRPEVDPAGAGRKNERLSREVCHLALRLWLQ